MADPLADLEAQRSALLAQMARMGDMRKGSITEAFRACGKPTCACCRSDHPGHGPYYAFTTKVAGKTKTIQMRPGPRLEKFQREVDAYRQFRILSDKLFVLNEAICEARPDPVETVSRAALKKTSRRSSRRSSPAK
jgi:hypothetical protein